jgi:hypothetical protein
VTFIDQLIQEFALSGRVEEMAVIFASKQTVLKIRQLHK